MLIPLGKVTLVKDVHCVNIPLGSVVTVGGIVILTKLEHPWNAFSPKLVNARWDSYFNQTYAIFTPLHIENAQSA